MSTNSPSSNPASLRDILLKAAVIDFEKIFLDTHLVQGQVRRGMRLVNNFVLQILHLKNHTTDFEDNVKKIFCIKY